MPTAVRRTFLRACLLAPAAAVLAACGQQVATRPTALPAAPTAAPSPAPPPTAAASATVPAPTAPAAAPEPAAAPAAVAPLEPTPACDDDPEPTVEQTAGPFYTPNTPERTSLIEPGAPGTPLLVTGYVLTTDCRPVERAMLDFWHADDSGQYDNVGFRMRGHQYTDAQGAYRLETILPGLYPGRTRHIHVILQAPDRPPLTTQLYFPAEPANDRDGFFDARLVVAMSGGEASFTFVVG